MSYAVQSSGCGAGTLYDEKSSSCIVSPITKQSELPVEAEPMVEPEPVSVTEPEPEPEPMDIQTKCGKGTRLENGICVIDKSDTTKGSGCLIATATYGTELSPQVQLLREVRDNVLFGTNSGTVFMTGFNEFYYSFSPVLSDWERQRDRKSTRLNSSH